VLDKSGLAPCSSAQQALHGLGQKVQPHPRQPFNVDVRPHPRFCARCLRSHSSCLAITPHGQPGPQSTLAPTPASALPRSHQATRPPPCPRVVPHLFCFPSPESHTPPASVLQGPATRHLLVSPPALARLIRLSLSELASCAGLLSLCRVFVLACPRGISSAAAGFDFYKLAATGASCMITAAEAHSLALAWERSPVRTHTATSQPAAVGRSAATPQSPGSAVSSNGTSCHRPLHADCLVAGTAMPGQRAQLAGKGPRWPACCAGASRLPNTGGSTWSRLKLLAPYPKQTLGHS